MLNPLRNRASIVVAAYVAVVCAYALLPWVTPNVGSQDGPSHLNAARIFWDLVLGIRSRNLDFYAIRPHFYTNLGVDLVALPSLPLLGPLGTEKLLLSAAIILFS